MSLSVPSGWPAPSTAGSDPGFTKTSAGVLSVAGQTLTISGLTRSETQPVTITYGAKSSGGPARAPPAAGGSQSWQAQSRASAAGTLQPLASSPAVAVLSPDGSGTISPSPATVAKGSAGNTISFTYTAATGGMQNGTITLVVPSGWSAPSTTSTDPGFVTASTGSLTLSGRTITVAGINLNGADTMTITYGNRSRRRPRRDRAHRDRTDLDDQAAVSAERDTHCACVLSPRHGDGGRSRPLQGRGRVRRGDRRPARGRSLQRQDHCPGLGQQHRHRLLRHGRDRLQPSARGPPTSAPFTAGVLASQPVTFAQGGLLSTVSVVQTGGTAGGISNAFTTYAADGSGTMTVSPTAVRSGSAGNTLAFVYTPAPGGISTGPCR